MVTRPVGRSGGTVVPVSDIGAGQDHRWPQRGLKATEALAETWGALAEVCHELSTSEWGLPTECPGWDVKDQLSHLIGIERSILGEPAPAWDGPLGPHVRNDVGAMNERWIAVRRPRPGADVQAEFVEVTDARLAQLAGRTEEQWAAVGWSPVGDVPYAVATVDLDGGARMFGRIEPPGAARIGARVSPLFVDHGDWTELRFRAGDATDDDA